MKHKTLYRLSCKYTIDISILKYCVIILYKSLCYMIISFA